MDSHPPSFDRDGRKDVEKGTQEDAAQRSPRDAAYDRTGDPRWEDELESSSRQGPPGQIGIGASSPGFPVAGEDGESMSATEAAKLRLFKALRTAKACDVSSSFSVLRVIPKCAEQRHITSACLRNDVQNKFFTHLTVGRSARDIPICTRTTFLPLA